MDLGCGLGLTGVAAARRGAAVSMVDYDADALLFARFNVLQNLSPPAADRVTLALVDWRNEWGREMMDLVIGSDVVYERQQLVPLLRFLHQVVGPAGEAILAEPDREIGTSFLRITKDHGFAVEVTPATVERYGRTSTIRLLHLRRQADSMDESR
jgi:predicted nicotinamide N-methyase